MTRRLTWFALDSLAVTAGILATAYVGMRAEERHAAYRQARKRGMAMHPSAQRR